MNDGKFEEGRSAQAFAGARKTGFPEASKGAEQGVRSANGFTAVRKMPARSGLGV
jgi:hypothetical protein